MQLLDATLAFTLTLAALAIVVTIIMEAALRVAQMRKKNLVEVIKLLNKELDKGALGLSADERWQFIVNVIENPAEAAAGGLAKKQEGKKLNECLAALGSDQAAGKGGLRRFGAFLSQLKGDSNRGSLYDKVSLEHVLRRLSEIESVQRISRDASETVKAELNRLARKYEEFSSAVSVGFRRHAQAWSITIGIALAIFANIDGLRIFEAYLADADLAKAVIEQQDTFVASHEEALARKVEFDKAKDIVDRAKEELNETKAKAIQVLPGDSQAKKDAEKEVKKREQALSQAQAALDAMVSLEEIQKTAQRAQQQLADLVELGVPLGWRLYPNCPYGGQERWESSSPQCRALPQPIRNSWFDSNLLISNVANTAVRDPVGFLRWLFAVTVTGLLIGLGAPFWFDIAKRLVQIRQGLRSMASDEKRLAANDADGDPEKRRKIVDDVIADAAGVARGRRLFIE